MPYTERACVHTFIILHNLENEYFFNLKFLTINANNIKNNNGNNSYRKIATDINHCKGILELYFLVFRDKGCAFTIQKVFYGFLFNFLLRRTRSADIWVFSFCWTCGLQYLIFLISYLPPLSDLKRIRLGNFLFPMNQHLF